MTRAPDTRNVVPQLPSSGDPLLDRWVTTLSQSNMQGYDLGVLLEATATAPGGAELVRRLAHLLRTAGVQPDDHADPTPAQLWVRTRNAVAKVDLSPYGNGWEPSARLLAPLLRGDPTPWAPWLVYADETAPVAATIAAASVLRPDERNGPFLSASATVCTWLAERLLDVAECDPDLVHTLRHHTNGAVRAAWYRSVRPTADELLAGLSDTHLEVRAACATSPRVDPDQLTDLIHDEPVARVLRAVATRDDLSEAQRVWVWARLNG